jgi:hypothetical protein
VQKFIIIIVSVLVFVGLLFGGYNTYRYFELRNNLYTEEDVSGAYEEGAESGSLYSAYLLSLINDILKQLGNGGIIPGLDELNDYYSALFDTINDELNEQGANLEELSALKLVSLMSLQSSLISLKTNYTVELGSLQSELADIEAALLLLEDIDSDEVIGFVFAKSYVELRILNTQDIISKLDIQIFAVTEQIEELSVLGE